MFQEPLSEKIWKIKYRYCHPLRVVDHTIEDTWHRVAKAIASAETLKKRNEWETHFYDILRDFHFLPGGRILAGAGTSHHVTLFNCFVIPILKDSLSGIFKALKEGALTLQQGGGVGYDFSPLRPRGSWVKKIGIGASGPVSFMNIWDAMCAVMVSTGARRGAMMGILRCDHPDIEEFIHAKENRNALRQFNVSVLVTDRFMHAVKENQAWDLAFPGQPVSRQVNARSLWDAILSSAYHTAEPGVLFADTINAHNNLWYREQLSATNPCGEIPLPAYGACNLGAINLTQFVTDAFTPRAAINWKKLESTTRIATRFLDNVISVSRYPLKRQREEAMGTRRIGLGITGLGDVFVMLGMRYGSQASLTLAKKIMQCISEATWESSIELAKEKKSFPRYDKKKYSQGQFVQQLSNDLQKKIKKYGMRNSHHNTIAPTGTTSLLANNVSNGIEPIFAGEYERNVRMLSGEIATFSVVDYALRSFRKHVAEKKLPPAWIDTQSLTPEDHLAMQAVMQPYIDNAISKTINLPETFPFEKLNDVYTRAHELGLKGCTIFRPNPVTGVVLNVKPCEDVDRC